MPLKGDLASIDLAHVFQMLTLNQKAGTLEILTEGVRTCVYFTPKGIVYPHHTDEGEDKPAATPYEQALEELALPPGEVVAFEDSPTGASAAVEAGIPVVGISSGHAPEELAEAGVEIVVGDYKDPALYSFLGWD